MREHELGDPEYEFAVGRALLREAGRHLPAYVVAYCPRNNAKQVGEAL